MVVVIVNDKLRPAVFREASGCGGKRLQKLGVKSVQATVTATLCKERFYGVLGAAIYCNSDKVDRDP